MRLHVAALLILLPGFGSPNQEDAKNQDAFWSKVAELRKAAKDNCIDYDDAERVYKSWKPEELRRFWEEVSKRLEESYRWDIWAVGSILEGHLDVEFFLDFQLLIILQGREFYEGALKDPKSIAGKFTEHAPSTKFNLFFLRTAALNVYAESRAGGLEDPDKKRKGRDPAGKKWTWRDLKTLHPDLWEKYFLKRDRRPDRPDFGVLKDDDLVWKAGEPLQDWLDIYSEPDYYLEQIKALSKSQRCLIGVLWMEIEVNNGGYHQFFGNSTGIVATEALEGLEVFGANEVEKNLRKIMAAFPGGAPSRDREKRNQQLEALGKDKKFSDALEAATDLDTLASIMAKYIRAHPDEFFRPAKK